MAIMVLSLGMYLNDATWRGAESICGELGQETDPTRSDLHPYSRCSHTLKVPYISTMK